MRALSFFVRSTLFLPLSVFFANYAQASDDDSIRTDKSIVVSYWGSLNNNPGIKLGIGKTRTFSSKYSVNSSLSLLVNRKPDIYTSAGVALNNSLRRTGKCGLFLEHGIDFGYLGSYYDFDFYRTNSADEIVNMGRKWVSSIILGYSLGVGYDFEKKTNTNVQIFVKPGIYYRFPSNDNIFYLNRFNLEIGCSFHPRWLTRRNS